MSGTKGVVRRALKYGVLPLSLLAAGGVVWQASYAAFSATTRVTADQVGADVLAADASAARELSRTWWEQAAGARP